MAKTNKKKRIVKAWSIHFNGNSIERSGLCNWESKSQLEIFSTKKEATTRLKDYIPMMLDAKKEEFSIIPITISYTI